MSLKLRLGCLSNYIRGEFGACRVQSALASVPVKDAADAWHVRFCQYLHLHPQHFRPMRAPLSAARPARRHSPEASEITPWGLNTISIVHEAANSVKGLSDLNALNLPL